MVVDRAKDILSRNGFELRGLKANGDYYLFNICEYKCIYMFPANVMVIGSKRRLRPCHKFPRLTRSVGEGCRVQGGRCGNHTFTLTVTYIKLRQEMIWLEVSFKLVRTSCQCSRIIARNYGPAPIAYE